MFSSVAQSHPTLCDPMDCSTPGFPVHHQLLELVQTPVHSCHPTISFSVVDSSSSFPASGSFLMGQFFASGGQGIGVSVSASVLPMNIQDWFPLVLKVWSPCSQKDSQESSSNHSWKASILQPSAFFMVKDIQKHSWEQENWKAWTEWACVLDWLFEEFAA